MHINQAKTFRLRTIATLLPALIVLAAKGQVQNIVVYKADGSSVRYKVESVDSIVFEQIPKWSQRSQEAKNLLAYLEGNVRKKILTSTHALSLDRLCHNTRRTAVLQDAETSFSPTSPYFFTTAPFVIWLSVRGTYTILYI